MEKVLKDIFNTDEVEFLHVSSGGSISEGKGYRIGQRKMFIKTNSKEQVKYCTQFSMCRERLFRYIICIFFCMKTTCNMKADYINTQSKQVD